TLLLSVILSFLMVKNELFVSIPVGLLTTIIWEFSISKNKKVYENDSVSNYLSAIYSKDEAFVTSYLEKIIKVYTDNKIFLSKKDELTQLSKIKNQNNLT
ncbi:MAG: hypothetical protein ACRC3B_03825, partial [Bacteroidia bacterium]